MIFVVKTKATSVNIVGHTHNHHAIIIVPYAVVIVHALIHRTHQRASFPRPSIVFDVIILHSLASRMYTTCLCVWLAALTSNLLCPRSPGRVLRPHIMAASVEAAFLDDVAAAAVEAGLGLQGRRSPALPSHNTTRILICIVLTHWAIYATSAGVWVCVLVPRGTIHGSRYAWVVC